MKKADRKRKSQYPGVQFTFKSDADSQAGSASVSPIREIDVPRKRLLMSLMGEETRGSDRRPQKTLDNYKAFIALSVFGENHE